ncbi:hypothetical protein ABZ744_12155 [Micromonospora chersina]|uniref:hypothetical protein n=1 Tax=Micromonospora chersina TaxID=47854 RepID=UPI0033E8E37C
MTAIESDRRKSELCPRLRVACEPFNPGSDADILRLRVALIGPPGLDRLDRLTVAIRNDHHRRGKSHQQRMDGPSQEEIKQHIWGPYRFSPHTGPDDAHPDDAGRQVVYGNSLPLGEELPYQMEHTLPGYWMGMTQQSWLRERGTVIRLAFTAEHQDHGTWYLPCEIDTGTMPLMDYVPQQERRGVWAERPTGH